MASYLIDKLEALKTNELEIKEQQRILEEEIAFEMEKQRRLEMEGTITKLRTQIGEFSKNIEGLIMPNNISLVLEKNGCAGLSEQQIREARDNRRTGHVRQYITLSEFKNNIKQLKDKPIVDRSNARMINILHTHKIYDDIIPLFTTIMGIIKKQGEEIKKLKSNI